MTFQDIFKSSFLENIASISILDMAIAMVLAFLLGLFIFFIYKKSYSGVMYSASFGVTLIALSLITTLLIMTVVSNIVLSLGMVGALSIVRFRTASCLWAWWALCPSSGSAPQLKSPWISPSCSGPLRWALCWPPA